MLKTFSTLTRSALETRRIAHSSQRFQFAEKLRQAGLMQTIEAAHLARREESLTSQYATCYRVVDSRSVALAPPADTITFTLP